MLPDFIYFVVDSLSKVSELSEQEQLLIASINLAIENDANLNSYLKSNYSSFIELVKNFANADMDKLNDILTKLKLSSVYKSNDYSECIFISIFESGYLETGYIYCEDKTKLPRMDSMGFIIVDEIIKDWFLFRRN